jgi:hypothetical protein
MCVCMYVCMHVCVCVCLRECSKYTNKTMYSTHTHSLFLSLFHTHTTLHTRTHTHIQNSPNHHHIMGFVNLGTLTAKEYTLFEVWVFVCIHITVCVCERNMSVQLSIAHAYVYLFLPHHTPTPPHTPLHHLHTTYTLTPYSGLHIRRGSCSLWSARGLLRVRCYTL